MRSSHGYGPPGITIGWRVHYVPVELPVLHSPLPFVAELPGDWDRWLVEDGIPERTPFLMLPTFEYDVELNAFFRSAGMVRLSA